MNGGIRFGRIWTQGTHSRRRWRPAIQGWPDLAAIASPARERTRGERWEEKKERRERDDGALASGGCRRGQHSGGRKKEAKREAARGSSGRRHTSGRASVLGRTAAG